MLIRYVVTLRPWPLTSWTWTFTPRLSYWWFSTLSPCNFRGWGTITERFSGVHGPNFTNLGRGIGQSFSAEEICFTVRLSCWIFKCGQLNQSWVMLKTTHNFVLFDPVKLRGGWARSLNHYWSFIYNRTSGIHLMAIHCAAAECGVSIKNK